MDELAAELKVNKRTVWRDLAALQEAGFPLMDDKRDRKTVWRVMQLPLKSLTDAGLEANANSGVAAAAATKASTIWILDFIVNVRSVSEATLTAVGFELAFARIQLSCRRRENP